MVVKQAITAEHNLAKDLSFTGVERFGLIDVNFEYRE
jgi:hypothetical protein